MLGGLLAARHCESGGKVGKRRVNPEKCSKATPAALAAGPWHRFGQSADKSAHSKVALTPIH